MVCLLDFFCIFAVQMTKISIMKTYNYEVTYKEELDDMSYECEADCDGMDEIKEEIESAEDFDDVIAYEIWSDDGKEHFKWERK